MSEQTLAHHEETTEENIDAGRLSLEDALRVAYDPTVKEHIDSASANRRVARRLAEGAANGEGAMLGIVEREKLAHLALGEGSRDKYLYGLAYMLDKALTTHSAKRKLRGQNYQMLTEEGEAAMHLGSGGYKNPYFDSNREKMTPGEIRDAEVAKAADALNKADLHEAEIDERTKQILGAKEASDDVTAQLATIQAKLAGRPELSSGKSWEVYGKDETNEELASGILEIIRNTPGLHGLIEQGLRDLNDEQ